MNTYTLQLTHDQLATLARGLEELPYKIAHPIVVAIQMQVNGQINAQAISPRAATTDDAASSGK